MVHMVKFIDFNLFIFWTMLPVQLSKAVCIFQGKLYGRKGILNEPREDRKITTLSSHVKLGHPEYSLLGIYLNLRDKL